MDPAETFDAIIDQARATLNSPPSVEKRSGLARLKLAKERRPKISTMVHRSAALIQDGLRQLLRRLVSGEEPWPLYLFGPAGVGKTCAVLSLLDYVDMPAPEFCYFSAYTLMLRMESWRKDKDPNRWPERLLSRIESAPLLVLEEIGTRDTVTSAQYDLVKEVIERRHNKPFIVTSNVDLEAIGKIYDARILSRLGAGTVFQLTDRDRRLE